MKQQANIPRSLYVSTKSITLQRAVDGLHARAVALIARSKSFVSSSDTPQQQQSSSGREQGSSLTVSGGRALLELYENVTQMYLSRLKHGLLPDKTKVPAPVVAMKKSSIHANTCRPPAASARDLRKTRLSLDERRISFGRHTKLSFGGRELAERTAGGRRFTEEERVAALEQLKIAHEKDVRNYRARLRKLEDHAHMYTEITQDKMHLLDRADAVLAVAEPPRGQRALAAWKSFPD